MKKEHRLEYFKSLGIPEDELLKIAWCIDQGKPMLKVGAVNILRRYHFCKLEQAEKLVNEIYQLLKK